MKKLISLVVVLGIILASWSLAQGTNAPGWGNAMWIWDEADANTVAQSNEPRQLRLSFTLSAKPQAAELWVTVDNAYIAYVNGVSVGGDKQWETVERIDVAKHLVTGKNVLAIQATNAGGVAGAIARLHVTSADKKDMLVVTDEKTKVRRIRAGSVSDGLAWTKLDFDDSSWSSAIVLGDTSIAPWSSNVFLAQGKGGKGKKGPGQFGYDTNETVNVKGRLTPEEQIKHFVVPKDFEIELVAADPLVINPITMVMDERGRIIVSESHTYRYGPKGSPIKPYANPVIRLDPDGKGSFTRTLIADGFTDPVMGIAVKGNKLWLTACDYLYTYDLPDVAAKPIGKDAFLPSPPVLRGRGAGGEGERAPGIVAPFLQSNLHYAIANQSPSPPTPLPLSTGGEGKTKPLATNKKTIVTDLNKAWNPFGMFVLEWGPDGKLYMSVGNHAINLVGPEKQKMSGRGSSGIIVRMEPDGSKMERLVHGLRVPYSYEMDPFGQLWLQSNGEGNPNRFVRVIEGVDYHCYSRPGVDNNWLAGNHPLAPPSEETHRGAHTQLMRYYGAAYPQEYQGNLFLCNWGAHGYAGPNRGIFRFVPDERNNISKREPLVWCKDPHFRPSHIILDQDGSLLIADWYGRDDESDMTGRIWRLKYVGKDRPLVKHKLDSPEWKDDDYAISALGSPSHLVRERAIEEVIRRGNQITKKLGMHAAKSEERLGAANAIWALVRLGGAEARREVDEGARNADWRVQRLALNLLRRSDVAKKEALDRMDKIRFGPKFSPQVALESALLTATHPVGLTHLRLTLTAPSRSIVDDPHLRYEAAWHFAKSAAQEDFADLLNFENANVRLAGLIAIDVACYENTPSKKAALAALAKAIENPGKLDHQLLLDVARLDGDSSIVPALEKLIARDDVPTATIAKAFLVLKAKAGAAYAVKAQGAGKRFVEAVEKGQLPIKTPADQLVLFEFLESEGPTPFALKQIGGQLQATNKDVRLAAHTLARRFGVKASSVAEKLWPIALDPKTKFDDAIESISTIARVEGTPQRPSWSKLLEHADPDVRLEAVRWWRHLPGKAPFDHLADPKTLLAKDPRSADDLGMLVEKWSPIEGLKLPGPEKDKEVLTKYALKELDAMPAADRTKRAAMGLQVFERNACTKCHTTATATTLLAPSLKGIAQQKADYLIESVLYPSKIIKTGWEVELIELKNGKTLTGLVKEDGKFLRIINIDKEYQVEKAEVDTRRQGKVSVMPEGQEATLSRREFVDLIAYLQTLK